MDSSGGYSWRRGAQLGYNDCNDNNASVWQNLSEYRDQDGDGYGAGTAVQKCSGATLSPDTGYVANNTDCDDSNSSVHPAQTGWFGTAIPNDGSSVAGTFNYACGGAPTLMYPVAPAGTQYPTSTCIANGVACNTTGFNCYYVSVSTPGLFVGAGGMPLSCGSDGNLISSSQYVCELPVVGFRGNPAMSLARRVD